VINRQTEHVKSVRLENVLDCPDRPAINPGDGPHRVVQLRRLIDHDALLRMVDPRPRLTLQPSMMSGTPTTRMPADPSGGQGADHPNPCRIPSPAENNRDTMGV